MNATQRFLATCPPHRQAFLLPSPATPPHPSQTHTRQGDAEALPFEADAFDRYVSAGSIEYWPDPQRGIAEAYRCGRGG